MQNVPAYITLFLEEDEKEKMTGLDKPNFDLFTAFKLDLLSFMAHFIQ